MSAAKTIAIPSILFEGDQPEPLVAGPGEKYALGPQPPVEPAEPGAKELPEAYGTGRLLLIARDPHWLYTHWDLTRDQQRAYNKLSADRHLIVRVHREPRTEQPAEEIHVHPESRHWFIEVERAGTRHIAELGYYDAARTWTTVAISKFATTPPDLPSGDKSARFVPVQRNLPPTVARAFHPENLPALLTPRASSEPSAAAESQTAVMAEGTIAADVPGPIVPPHVGWIPVLEGSSGPSAASEPGAWTEEQARALAELLSQPGASYSSLDVSGQAAPVSSPMGGGPPSPEGFWFRVNAELVVYGATQPNASVTIGGQPIPLRPDGSFSVRLALPEGTFQLPVTAHAASGEMRQADLHFSRRTECKGEVGAEPAGASPDSPCA